VIAFVNITDQVNADIQLHRSEARAHTILNSVADGVIVTDEDELVTLFNPGAQRLTGLTEEQTLGQPLKTVFKFKEEGIVHGVTADGGDVQQGSVLSAQGAAVAIELLVSEILDAEERSGRVYTFRDVGEQLRYEQEQATLDKMTSVGVLAGGIAHDFNNLLTAVYGNVSLAESVIDQPEKALVFLKRSSESIQMAANLTKQLLTFATGSEPVRNVTNAEQLVREAVGFALSGSSVAVTFDVESDVDDIEVDSGQVQQAIGNIVLNAKQALRDEGLIEIVVRNSARRVESSDSFVEVVIKDNGPGMDSVILSRIFDPYFTTKEHGTGLGLATTHSILVKHEGAITVDSSQGEGARFAILLPSAKKIVDTREVQEPGNLVPAGALEVLVMDDEDIVLQTIVDLLTYLGHNTTASHHGEEAVSTYIDRLKQGRRFDLVVMDLTVIGGMGGKAAAALILEHDPEARIVVSSGYSADAEMSRFKELGFVARLEKPFDSGALEAMISEVIR
jgi:two-component system cell cycle sensor histidine kinase/response regulator CckA